MKCKKYYVVDNYINCIFIIRDEDLDNFEWFIYEIYAKYNPNITPPKGTINGNIQIIEDSTYFSEKLQKKLKKEKRYFNYDISNETIINGGGNYDIIPLLTPEEIDAQHHDYIFIIFDDGVSLQKLFTQQNTSITMTLRQREFMLQLANFYFGDDAGLIILNNN